MSEIRRVHQTHITSDLQAWLDSLPGRLFMLMVSPRCSHTWLAITIEDAP